MRNLEELKNLQRLLRQLRCQLSFDTRRDAQVLRTLPEEQRVLQLEELEQLEELAVRALQNWAERALLRSLAVRALLRSLAVRAFNQRPWDCVQASLA